MPNDEGLVDEFEELEFKKKEIEQKEAELKKRILELAKQKNTDTLFGTHKKCSIKEYDKIIYPEDKTQIINLLKQKNLWADFEMINYSRFGSRAMKNELDRDILDLIRKEKAFRISLRNI